MQRTATIPLSGTVSDDIDLRSSRRLVAIAVPVITSGDLLIRGSFDGSSGSFVRVSQGDSGDLRFPTGPGSNMILWPDTISAPSYIRLETSVAQAAAREFTVRTSAIK